jgi:hypothetical protein
MISSLVTVGPTPEPGAGGGDKARPPKYERPFRNKESRGTRSRLPRDGVLRVHQDLTFWFKQSRFEEGFIRKAGDGL